MLEISSKAVICNDFQNEVDPRKPRLAILDSINIFNIIAAWGGKEIGFF